MSKLQASWGLDEPKARTQEARAALGTGIEGAKGRGRALGGQS